MYVYIYIYIKKKGIAARTLCPGSNNGGNNAPIGIWKSGKSI